MPSNPVSSPRHIAGIDGMRAIAVLAVIVFHFSAATLPGGFVGVDVFFVISGYVVTASLLRKRAIETRSFLVEFYARRVIRIYPALIVCALLTALAYTLLVPQAYISDTNNKTGLAAFFGLSNFALILFDDGYFSPRVEFNAYTHTWSLAVEEQFYLIFPLLLLVYLKARDRSPRGGNRATWAMLGITVASLLYSAWETSAAPTRAYYLLPGRFWELGVGALLALRQSRPGFPAAGKRMADALAMFGMMGIIAACFVTRKTGFPYPGAILPVGASIMLLMGITSDRSGASKWILEGRVVTYIGRISYSLYLWHWPVIVLLRWTVGADSPASLLAACFATAALASASFHLVEDPVRNSRRVHARPPSAILITGMAAIGVSCMVAAGVFTSRSAVSLSVTKDRAVWQPDAQWGAMPSAPLAGRPTLFLLGDSHAWAYSGLAATLRIEGQANVSRSMVFGCSNAGLRKPASPDCAARMDAAIDAIGRSARPGDFVLLGALRMPRLGDQWATFDLRQVVESHTSPEAQADRARALDEADRVVARLERAGLRVILDAPKPVFRSPPFRCADGFNHGNPICAPGLTVARHDLDRLREPVMRSIGALAQRHPRLIVWDPFDVLCPGPVCPAFDGPRPLFFDGDHLSGYGNAVLYPHFRSLLVAHGLLGG